MKSINPLCVFVVSEVVFECYKTRGQCFFVFFLVPYISISPWSGDLQEVCPPGEPGRGPQRSHGGRAGRPSGAQRALGFPGILWGNRFGMCKGSHLQEVSFKKWKWNLFLYIGILERLKGLKADWHLRGESLLPSLDEGLPACQVWMSQHEES